MQISTAKVRKGLRNPYDLRGAADEALVLRLCDRIDELEKENKGLQAHSESLRSQLRYVEEKLAGCRHLLGGRDAE